jgi:hypothetical protein
VRKAPTSVIWRLLVTLADAAKLVCGGMLNQYSDAAKLVCGGMLNQYPRNCDCIALNKTQLSYKGSLIYPQVSQLEITPLLKYIKGNVIARCQKCTVHKCFVNQR